jgi:hypothetical protein
MRRFRQRLEQQHESRGSRNTGADADFMAAPTEPYCACDVFEGGRADVSRSKIWRKVAVPENG